MAEKLLTPEVETLLRKHQMRWIDNGNAWDSGFVQGLEYLIKSNGESLEGVYDLEKYKND